MSYLIPKRFGKRTFGIVLSASLILLIAFVPFRLIKRDLFFFKATAKKLLYEKHEISLHDKFKILSNHRFGYFFTDYQEFELKISGNDHDRILSEIKENNIFSEIPIEITDQLDNTIYSDTTVYARYKSGDNIFFEIYKRRQGGYLDVRYIVSVSETENKLLYIRTE